MRFGSGHMETKPESFSLYFSDAVAANDYDELIVVVVVVGRNVMGGLALALRSFNHTPVAPLQQHIAYITIDENAIDCFHMYAFLALCSPFRFQLFSDSLF